MNERLRHLAEQAAKDVIDGQPITLQYTGKFAEQFAELIINECADIIEQYRIIDDGTMPVPRVKFKNHFGIQ